MKTESNSIHTVTADVQCDFEGRPKAFVLKHNHEEITLQPGKSWQQLDIYKWVTRGLIDEPRGFHVLPDGSVEIHGEHIELADATAPSKLQEKITIRFAAAPSHPSHLSAHSRPDRDELLHSKKVVFRVRLDKLGHLMITAHRHGEKAETGVRGLQTLVRNGFMLKPKDVHLDPLLQFVEIDGNRFDSTAAGAAALENRLNASYAPAIHDANGAAVSIRANAAAPSGFDIQFSTVRAGARFEIKGHLSQENLDILQDAVKCQILRPGTLLRLSPPHLIIRRRRADGGEERIPELPDVSYLHITAAELERVLNHPVIRRNGVVLPILPQNASEQVVNGAATETAPHAQAPTVSPGGESPEKSPTERLTQPAPPAPPDIAPVVIHPPVALETSPQVSVPGADAPAVIAVPGVDSEVHALFTERDPLQINIQTFRRLEACLGLPNQNLQLSLDMVFADRRFEILSFTHPEISDVLQIRSNEFSGFYLSYINEHRILLDYAHLGRRIEWGPNKCCLQTSVTADPEEFPSSALRGMALLESLRFAFVVSAEFKKWIKPRERVFEEAGASFITIETLAQNPEQYPLIWPAPTSA